MEPARGVHLADGDILPAEAVGGARHDAQTSAYARLWRRFCRNKGAVFGLAVFLAIVFMALFADLISPYDPLLQNYARPMESPSADHWLGTDSFGRDMLSRIIHGARIALVVGILAVLLAMLTVTGLLVYSIMQRQVHLYLRTHDQQLPGNTGMTATPTAAVVLALFAQVALVEFWRDEHEVMQIAGVQPHHLLICDALGLDYAWYEAPAEHAPSPRRAQCGGGYAPPGVRYPLAPPSLLHHRL